MQTRTGDSAAESPVIYGDAMNKRTAIARAAVLFGAVLAISPPLTAFAEEAAAPQDTTAAAAETTAAETTTTIETTTTTAVPSKPEAEYEDTEGGVRLTLFRWMNQNEVVIPEQADGKPVVEIGENAFRYCYADTVRLPDTVRIIGAHAFDGCVYLKEIKIPESCQEISDGAFQNCSALEKVDLPESLRHIGSGAFDGTPYLNAVRDDAVILGDGFLYAYKGNAAEVTVPEQVKIIGARAFADHAELKSLVIPKDVQRIMPEAFAGCTALADITCNAKLAELAPDAFSGTKWADAKDDFLILGDVLTAYHGSMQEVTVPDGVRMINTGAFSGNPTVTTVTLPDSVQEIRPEAFAYCASLQIVQFGDHVRCVGENAFLGCGILNYMRFGHSLEEIGTGAFAGCPYLETVYLPDTLQTIGSYAFGYRKEDDGSYTKMNNAVTLYANTECAVKYTQEAQVQLAPLPEAENTKPAPKAEPAQETETASGLKVRAAWVTAAAIGLLLICGALLLRLTRRSNLY